MVGVNPGSFRDKLVFKRLVRTPDGAGGTTASTVTAFTVFGFVQPHRAIKVVEDGKLHIITPYTVVIRTQKDAVPQPDMLVEYKGKEYRIQDIQEVDTYGRYLKLTISK